MNLIRWDPGDLGRWPFDPERLWSGLTAWPARLNERLGPSVDLYEEAGELVAEAELPGMKPEELRIRVTPDALHLQGERAEEEERREEGYYRRERRTGSFSRTVALPAPVLAEQSRATFEDGVLRVRMPKARPEPAGYDVPIERGH